MKRLLAINWEMPPLSGPRAVQVTRTLRHLVPLGWASTVICFGPRSNRYNQQYPVDVEADTQGAVEVVRVSSPEERLFFRALWRACPPAKLLPDEKWVWIGPAVRAARRALGRNRFDAIVSFGQPWSDHLIGLRLHRETRLPWVAHFSDPWVDNPYVRGAGWQRRIWSRMERDVVGEATRVVFLTRQTAERTLEKYPREWAGKASVIPQGFEDPPPVRPVASREDRDQPLRIVYTGRFYPGLRTPDAVLRAIARLDASRALRGRLIIDFYGEPAAEGTRLASSLNLEGIVTFHGRVPPPVAAEACGAADALLVIDAPSRGPSLFLPSKLVDYLPFVKPIIGVTPLEGAAADVLKALAYPMADPADIDGIARVFSDTLDCWSRRALQPSSSHHSVARQFDIRETTRMFAGLLDSAVPHAA